MKNDKPTRKLRASAFRRSASEWEEAFVDWQAASQRVLDAGIVLSSDLERSLADKPHTVDDDAQLANVELQSILQKQQQTLQMMSNISKMLHDTAMAVIRKIGG
jgi:hypothetical protein